MEILLAFLRLGLTSFGGPVAHLGYFRAEFVRRRRWLDEAEFADLVAMCSFLPGPTSSQVGMAIGLRRGGPVGALAAWTGFTLPSALLMFLAAGHARDLAALRGLGLVAVAVVAQALIGMARALTPDLPRALIAIAAGTLVLSVPGPGVQPLAIGLGALAGLPLARTGPRPTGADHGARLPGVLCLAAFAALLVLPGLGASPGSPLALFDSFDRAGALVFGGGHVVLPLLQDRIVGQGWVSEPDFLAGYGAVQAMPGPLFTVATYLGALGKGVPGGLAGAAIATVAIFAPGLLAAAGVLPFWSRLRGNSRAAAAMAGCNAAVVGILAAALWNPVITGAVVGPADALIAIGLLIALVLVRLPPVAVVLAGLLLAAARNHF